MVCHGFFMELFRFLMKAMLITECYYSNKKQSIAPITAADDITILDKMIKDQ